MTPETIKCLCKLNINNHLQPEESLEDWFERLTDVAYYIAQNPSTSSETLAILAKDSDLEVRYWVAQNPNSHSETLALLASDSNWQVRWRVAQNPNTSSEIISILAVDSDNDVKFEAKKQLKQRNKI